MPSYVALLRGINVGGKNQVSMADLAASFADAGFGDVRTHSQSGNVLFTSGDDGGSRLEKAVERMLEKRFGIPSRSSSR